MCSQLPSPTLYVKAKRLSGSELGLICVVLVFQLGTVDDDSVDDYYTKSVTLNKQQCQVLLRLIVRKTGCFRARISYKDQPLSNGEFDIIVLSGELPFTCSVVISACSRRAACTFQASYADSCCLLQRMKRPVWKRMCPPRA